jgi:hypothetical protein
MGRYQLFRKRFGRLAATFAAAVAVFALAASPALAHFCSKSGWSEAALAHAGGSQAWLTADEWLGFLGEVEAAGEICPAGADNLRAQIASRPANTLFMGPGLLAGGTLKNGKGNTPEHFQYLDFESAFGLCG